MGAGGASWRIVIVRGNVQDGTAIRRDGIHIQLVLGILGAEHTSTGPVDIAGGHLPILIRATVEHPGWVTGGFNSQLRGAICLLQEIPRNSKILEDVAAVRRRG